MIKWVEESDSEVNRSIALLTGEDPDKWYPYGGMKGKDYCNNPSDAWPFALRLPLAMRTAYLSQPEGIALQLFKIDADFVGANNRPLRAAMVCFLLSKTCA